MSSSNAISETTVDQAERSQPYVAGAISFSLLFSMWLLHAIGASRLEKRELALFDAILASLAATIALMWLSHTAECMRRGYNKSYMKVVRESWGGREVTNVHRFFAINYIVICYLWSVMCWGIVILG